MTNPVGDFVSIVTLVVGAAHSTIVAEEWSKPYVDLVDKPIRADYFGLLPNKLKELDLEENTILIFMTDNGTYLGAQIDNNNSDAT